MAILFLVLIFFLMTLNLGLAVIAYFSPEFTSFYSYLLYGNSAILVVLLLVSSKRFQAINKPINIPPAFSNNHYFSDQWIIQNVPNVLCIKDDQGRWLEASHTFLQLFGLSQVEFKGKNNKELSQLSNNLENSLRLNSLDEEPIWKKGKPVTHVEHVNNAVLKIDSIAITTVPVFDLHQNRYKLIICGNEITANQKKLQSLQTMSSVFKFSPESFFILDLNFGFYQINQAFSKLTGYSSADVINQHISKLNDEQNSPGFFQTIQIYVERNQHWQGEMYCMQKNGDTFHAKLRLSSVLRKNSDKPKHYIGIISDITKEKETEQHYVKLAHYDDLTNLPNRVMFIKRLEQVLSRTKRHNYHAVLLFIDLDHFKSINDTIGHQGGDELLKETAKRLQETVRKEDVVARLSGDEFAILIYENLSHNDVTYAASKIATNVIKALTASYYIQKRELFIGASIGIAIAPEDAVGGEDLLKHADIAMYKAKSEGRNNYQFFQKDLINNINDRHQMQADLRNGLKKDEFRLFFQPQYDAVSRKLIGAEVLVRWFTQFDKMVPVYKFIPVAEESGLIIPLGNWILETACKKQKQWLDQGFTLKQVSVNVSARQFSQPDFVEIVEKALQKSGLPAHHLELEITESMLIGDIKKVILQLQRLHNLGISLAIDDFGTGYSSLSYLKDFPIDILKIDQSFVRDTPESIKDCKIVCAIVEMGHSLGLKIVAEGVETEEQLEFLNTYNCDYIQGYLFSKPLPETEMLKLLQNIS